MRYLRASAALGALRTASPSSSYGALRIRAAIRGLRRDQVPWAAPYAELLAASLSHLARNYEECSRRLALARDGFVRFGSYHMVDIVDRARLLSEAPDRVHEAEARLRARGVARPDRFAAMLAPAFG
jgi:hypothetical protein